VRQSIKQFVRLIADTLPVSEPIYEFGSLQVEGQEGLANLRPIFPDKQYVGCDMREGPGVDRVLNIHELDLASESVGTVLMLDTVEHVEFVRKALEEVHRILKPSGILVVTSVMNFPIHSHPYDYWRFTPEGLKSLLKPFSSSIVAAVGEEYFPHSVVGLGFKGALPQAEALNDLESKLERWKQDWSNPGGRSRLTFLKRVAPPILLDFYRRVKGVLT